MLTHHLPGSLAAYPLVTLLAAAGAGPRSAQCTAIGIGSPLQQAIDAAAPGDVIVIGPAGPSSQDQQVWINKPITLLGMPGAAPLKMVPQPAPWGAGVVTIGPDVVGRGVSDRLADPMGYTVPQYVADIVTLLARLDARSVDWVGTSMGGLIGLGVAALDGSPLRRLVLNDVGPTIEPESLQRIGTYLGVPARWRTLDEAADAMQVLSHGFGPHTREQWLALSAPQLTTDAEGFLVPRYDPRIAVPFKAVTPEIAKAGEAMLWQAWDRLRIPTLLLRGKDSDLLSHATAQAMGERGPRARLVEFDGVGHAPTLVPEHHGYSLGDEVGRAALARIAEYGVPLMLTQRFEDRRQRHHWDRAEDLKPEIVIEAARTHPELKFLLVNWINLDGAQLVQAGLKGRCLLDFARLQVSQREEVSKLIESLGVEAIAFGSHMPFDYVGPSLVKLANLESLRPKDHEPIAWRNATKFLGLK